MKSFLLRILQTVFAWFVSGAAAKGHLEVERKFSISKQEAESLPLRLRELDFKPAGSLRMTDTFIPSRQKGEMMRVRDELIGSSARSLLTLKSWVQVNGGKERHECECKVSSLARTLLIVLARFASGKELLGFSKERALFEGVLNGRQYLVCLDRVSGLGEYSGHFLEVESTLPLGEDSSAVKSEIFKLAETLFGTPREDVKRSYLEMLEASRLAKS